jgi:hypothetical protein
MDATALALCRDQKLPINVFSIFKTGALKRVVWVDEYAGSRYAWCYRLREKRPHDSQELMIPELKKMPSSKMLKTLESLKATSARFAPGVPIPGCSIMSRSTITAPWCRSLRSPTSP